MALLGLVGGLANPPAAQVVILASGQGAPGNLLVDNSSVYWVNGFNLLISAVNKNPGGVVTHYSTYTLWGDPTQDNVFLYFIAGTDGVNNVYRLSKAGGSLAAIGNGNVSQAVNFAGDASSGDMAIGPAGGVLYYEGIENAPGTNPATDLPFDELVGTVESISTQGGANNTYIYNSFTDDGVNIVQPGYTYWPGANGDAEHFTTDSTYVYWTDGTDIWRMPLVGGSASAIVTGRPNIGYFATPTTGGAGGSIFWVENANGNVSLKRREVGGQIITVLTGLTSNAHRCFAVNNNTVFCERAGALVQVPITGGTPTVLAGLLQAFDPVGVAADSSYVYWSNIYGQILRVPQLGVKPPPPPVPPPSVPGKASTKTTKAKSTVSFKVSPVPKAGVTFKYKWQRWPARGTGWQTLGNSGGYGGVTTGTMSIKSVTSSMSGDRFQCIVSDSGGSTTSAVVTLSVQTAPIITRQPAAAQVVATSSNTFTILATGLPTPVYHWQRLPAKTTKWVKLSNGGAYSGATTSELTVKSVTIAMSGDQFECNLTNSLGSVTSKLTVTPLAASISSAPSSLTAGAGGSATFTISAGGVPAPSLRWQISTDGGATWTNLTASANFSGVTTAALKLENLTAAMSGDQFQCVAFNAGGSSTSSPATLTVDFPPVFTTQPVNAQGVEGSNVSFNVAASGDPAPTFQWFISTNSGSTWTALTDNGSIAAFAGSATTNLTFSYVTGNFSGDEFECVAINPGSSVTSAVANFTILDSAPVITQQPDGTAFGYTAGNGTEFVAATGWPTPTFQWQVSPDGGATWNNISDGTFYSGTNTPEVTFIDPTTGMAGYEYRCVISNLLGTATTTTATLTVKVGTPTRRIPG
jgi:hypothetical protein